MTTGFVLSLKASDLLLIQSIYFNELSNLARSKRSCQDKTRNRVKETIQATPCHQSNTRVRESHAIRATPKDRIIFDTVDTFNAALTKPPSLNVGQPFPFPFALKRPASLGAVSTLYKQS